MKIENLQQIIRYKNNQLERTAIRNAENIIEQIVNAQQVIASAQKQIVELRKELHQLEVEQLDASTILEN